MLQQRNNGASGRLCLALTGLLAVSSSGCGQQQDAPASAHRSKADGVSARFAADLERLNGSNTWSIPKLESIEDAFKVTVTSGDHVEVVGTHLFGEVNVIPYGADPQPPEASPHSPSGPLNPEATRYDLTGYIDSANAWNRYQLANPEVAMAQYFRPGDFGIILKHHRNEHRTLDVDNIENKLNNLKLWDTHIGVAVGIRREGADRVMSIDNPQDYWQWQFGSPGYPMIFFRPQLPHYLPEERKAAFRANMLTMLVGFNAVVPMAPDFDGGDYLGGRSPERIRQLVAMMVRAVAGDRDARAFFAQEKNMMYCAELVHVAMSAGLIVPLNKENVVPLLRQSVPAPDRDRAYVPWEQSAEAVWSRFEQQVTIHNARASYLALAPGDRPQLPAADDLAAQTAGVPFVDTDGNQQTLTRFACDAKKLDRCEPMDSYFAYGNHAPAVQAGKVDHNPYIQYVELHLAPQDLKPATSYCTPATKWTPPSRSCESERTRLALEPQTAYDLIAEFVRTNIPRDRDEFGEQVAPAQAHFVEAIRPDIYKMMGLPEHGCGWPSEASLAAGKAWVECLLARFWAKLAGIDELYDKFIAVIGKDHGDYNNFLAALAPLLTEARELKSPRDDEVTLLVPPSLYHATARRTLQGKDPGGLIGLRYVGHGIHWTYVVPANDEAAALVNQAKALPR